MIIKIGRPTKEYNSDGTYGYNTLKVDHSLSNHLVFWKFCISHSSKNMTFSKSRFLTWDWEFQRRVHRSVLFSSLCNLNYSIVLSNKKNKFDENIHLFWNHQANILFFLLICSFSLCL